GRARSKCDRSTTVNSVAGGGGAAAGGLDGAAVDGAAVDGAAVDGAAVEGEASRGGSAAAASDVPEPSAIISIKVDRNEFPMVVMIQPVCGANTVPSRSRSRPAASPPRCPHS